MLGPGFAHLQCCTDYAVLIQLPSGIENRNQETVQDCDILKRKSGRAHHNPEAAVLEMSLMGQHQPKKSVSNAASKQGSKHPSRHGSRHGSKHGSQHASSSAGAIRKPLARASEQQVNNFDFLTLIENPRRLARSCIHVAAVLCCPLIPQAATRCRLTGQSVFGRGQDLGPRKIESW